MNRQHLIVALLLAGVAAAPSQLSAQQQPAAKTPQPESFLSEAASTLDSLPKNVPHDAKDAIANLRKHVAALQQRYQAQRGVIGPPLTRTSATTEAPTWRDSFADAERDLVELIGAGSSYSEVTPTTVNAQNRSISMPTPGGSTAPGATATPPAGTAGPAPATAAAPAQPTSPGAVGTTGTSPVTAGTSSAPGTAVAGNGDVTAPLGTVPGAPAGAAPIAPANGTAPAGTSVTPGMPAGGANPAPVTPAQSGLPEAGATAPTPTPTNGASTTAPAAPSTAGTTPGTAATTPTTTPATSQPVVTAPQTTAGSSVLTEADALAASKVSLAGLKDLDPSLRAALERVRLQLELFYTATM